MKKSIIITLLILILALSSCSGNVADSKDKTEKEEATNTTSTSEMIKEEPTTKNSEIEEGMKAKYPLIKAVKVYDKIYYYTGEDFTGLKCGTPDGSINSKVPENMLPQRNEESNFDGVIEYQINQDDALPVLMNNHKWTKFCEKTPLVKMIENSSNIKSIKRRSQEEGFNPNDEIVYSKEDIENFISKFKEVEVIPIRMDEEQKGWTNFFTVEMNSEDEKYLISIMDDVMKVNKVYYQIDYIDFNE